MHAIGYVIRLAPSRHGISHLLDEFGSKGADDVKPQYLLTVLVHYSFGKAFFLHHGLTFGYTEVPGPAYQNLMILSGLLFCQANRCNLRHVAPKPLQKALYLGFSQIGQLLQVVWLGWSQFPVPEASLAWVRGGRTTSRSAKPN